MWNEEEREWDSPELDLLISEIKYLVDNCLGNMTVPQLEEVASRMEIFMRQGDFWLHEEDPKRFIYDLRDFGLWLCDYISDAEEKFWGGEKSP